MSYEWIKNLKVGDLVIVNDGGYYGAKAIKPVDKITPSGRLVVGKNTFLDNGDQYGGDHYWHMNIEEATPEAVKDIRRNQKVRAVYKKIKDMKSITYEQAVAIEKILRTEVTHDQSGL